MQIEGAITKIQNAGKQTLCISHNVFSFKVNFGLLGVLLLVVVFKFLYFALRYPLELNL